jgi:16S rRNA (cytosine967-C5)-methyltransferase
VGGRIVYSTCSIEPEENAQLVRDFVARTPNFSIVSQTEFVPGHPTDGGFQALLQRQS